MHYYFKLTNQFLTLKKPGSFNSAGLLFLTLSSLMFLLISLFCFVKVGEVIFMYLADYLAQCKQCKDIRDYHQGVEAICHIPNKINFCK